MNKWNTYRNIILNFSLILILSGTAAYSQNNPKHYTIGIMRNLFNSVNINDAGAVCNVWVKELNKLNKNKYDVDFEIYNNFNEVSDALKEGKLAFLALNVSNYIKYKNKFNLSPQFVASFKGDSVFRYQLLVRKEDNYKNLKDLKKTKIGITTKYDNTTPSLWFDINCAENNIHNKNYFKEIIASPNESQLILNLFFGKIDACIVPEKIFKLMAELNPQIQNRLIPIISSLYYLLSVMCFTKNFTDKTDREYFIENALDMQKLITGRQVLALMKIDKLVLFREDDLNSYLNLLNEHKNINRSANIFTKQNFQNSSD